MSQQLTESQKKYGIPTTEDEVIDIVRIPYFPVDGVQPIVTVNDPRLLPNGQKRRSNQCSSHSDVSGWHKRSHDSSGYYR